MCWTTTCAVCFPGTSSLLLIPDSEHVRHGFLQPLGGKGGPGLGAVGESETIV